MLRLGHLNIDVADVERSTSFYARWFGFDRILAEYPDATRFVTDAHGFELALHHAEDRAAGPPDWHFGFLAPEASDVRDLMAAMSAAGVIVGDAEDAPDYVGFKCADPDGHVIEVYWEPRR